MRIWFSINTENRGRKGETKVMNEKRLLDTFFEYVQINSETRNEREMCERE